MKIEVKTQPNPSIARVIIADEWKGDPIKAKQLLEDIYKKWPKGKKVKFLITCGGFLQFDWPKSITQDDIGDNKNPNKGALKRLAAKAKECAKSVLKEDLCKKLSKVTDYITLGVDSFKEKISTTQNYINQPHIELVFLKDLIEDELYCTGKSYPTTAQQNGLVRIADLESHFFDLDIGKVIILGCHDLNIFNPRSKNAKDWRGEVNKDFKESATENKPLYVLHHPHTTVKWRTWHNAWICLRKTLPSVKHYAGSGRYYESGRERSGWDALDKVLEDTKNTATIDFVIRINH